MIVSLDMSILKKLFKIPYLLKFPLWTQIDIPLLKIIGLESSGPPLDDGHSKSQKKVVLFLTTPSVGY